MLNYGAQMSIPKKEKLLSVIVPVFRQEKTIFQDLSQIKETLEKTRFKWEIICVIDGLVDQSFKEASRLKSTKVKVVFYPQNKGKGHAVRYGMARSHGDLIAFIDAGMEIDPNGISMVLEHMAWYQADVIVGSKRHPASQVNYPLNRRFLSLLYQLFVRFFTGLNVRDTQAGLKVFRRPVLEKVLPRLLVKHYAFDLEILSVARRLGFTRIFEAPIKISYNFTDLTHAHAINSMKKIFLDTLAVIYRLKILHYYDDRNRRKWRFDPDLNFRVNIG